MPDTTEAQPLWLEATCGHELQWNSAEPPPADWDCPEHGRVGLWAQRLSPGPGLPPMPTEGGDVT
jgi:hypothetical protein